MKNLKKFPITYYKRFLNRMGNRYVPCQVSGRGIKFPSESSWQGTEGEFIKLDIITHTSSYENPPSKICELVVTREDLERALNAVKKKNG